MGTWYMFICAANNLCLNEQIETDPIDQCTNFDWLYYLAGFAIIFPALVVAERIRIALRVVIALHQHTMIGH